MSNGTIKPPPARLPWAGPILGHQNEATGTVPITAVLDPAMGLSACVVLVPVQRKGERFTRGRKYSMVRAQRSDGNGWLTVEAKRNLWNTKVNGARAEGVLMALVYDAADASATIVLRAVDELLRRVSATRLEVGLVQLRSVARDTKRPKRVTFAISSCQFPAGILDAEIAMDSYRRLAARLNRAGAPEFLLLLGDQVYVDATAGMFDPTERFERFVAPYHELLSTDRIKNVLRRLPAYTMLDDHEIEDNWEPLATDDRNRRHLAAGRESYLKFQRAGGPPRKAVVGNSELPLWYDFEHNDFPFFVADTRTERKPRTAATIADAAIMDEPQISAIQNWLYQHRMDNIPKFIASPAIFLPRRLELAQYERTKTHSDIAAALRCDAWDGYPRSLHRLLGFLAEHEIDNVVFLSGDEHLSCVAQATVRVTSRKPVTVTSIHSSALHAPFPFANAVADTFPQQDRFSFSVPARDLAPLARRSGRRPKGERADAMRNFSCKTTVCEFCPGDGFAILDAFRERDQWKLRCHFDRAIPTNSRVYDLRRIQAR